MQIFYGVVLILTGCFLLVRVSRRPRISDEYLSNWQSPERRRLLVEWERQRED